MNATLSRTSSPLTAVLVAIGYLLITVVVTALASAAAGWVLFSYINDASFNSAAAGAGVGIAMAIPAVAAGCAAGLTAAVNIVRGAGRAWMPVAVGVVANMTAVFFWARPIGGMPDLGDLVVSFSMSIGALLGLLVAAFLLKRLH
jgi:hypothetical protein